MRALSLAAVAAISLLMAPAFAHPQALLDLDDSASPIDLAAVELRHEGRDVTLTMTTYEAWDESLLADDGKNYLSFEFQTDRDDTIDRCVVIDARDLEPGRRAGGCGLQQVHDVELGPRTA